jgi:hypothetical protein
MVRGKIQQNNLASCISDNNQTEHFIELSLGDRKEKLSYTLHT